VVSGFGFGLGSGGLVPGLIPGPASGSVTGRSVISGIILGNLPITLDMNSRLIGELDCALRRTETCDGGKSQAGPDVDFQLLLEGSLDMIWLSKVKAGVHRTVYCSPSTLQILGWTAEEMVHVPMADVFTPESIEVIAEDAARIVRGQQTTMIVVEAIRKDGAAIWLENKVRLLGTTPDGEMTVAVYMRDVTKRKHLEDHLARLAFIDGLTGIDNRRAFDETIEREWRRTLRTGSPLSLVLFDADHFKRFNDTYGHLVGDDCLRVIARSIRTKVNRPGDAVARYGGEEFAVLLPETDAEAAETVAEAICRYVAGLRIPHSANEARGLVTISGGVATAAATIGGTLKMPEGLVRAADAALYKAKSQGRNRIATAPPGECRP